MSDTYRKLVEKWVDEFNSGNIANNILVEMQDVLNSQLSKVKIPPKKNQNQYQCDICGNHNDADHATKHQSDYQKYISGFKTNNWENQLRSYIGENNYTVTKVPPILSLSLPKKSAIFSEQWNDFVANIASLRSFKYLVRWKNGKFIRGLFFNISRDIERMRN